VLEFIPTDEHAIRSLRGIYIELSAFGELYQIIDFEAAYIEDPERKLELYLEMSDVAKVQLDDPARQVDALEKARAIRDDLEILEPLLDAYIRDGRVELAEPLLEAIIDNLTSERRMKDVVRFYHLQGKLAEQKGDESAAHDAYLAAHKIDASYIPNLISLGKLLYRAQDWDESLKIFQTLLLHQMSIKSEDDKVDVYYHLGMVRLNQGDGRRAKDMFNRALNIDSEHAPSREALQQI
jgi:tetratricopeptide (TPR) repeat protein